MTLENRINAFVNLGEFLSQFSTKSIKKKPNILHNDLFFDVFNTQIKRSKEVNGWFDENNVLFSLESWSKSLTKENLAFWTKNYSFNNQQKTIAIIMAGNIPLVGFHDFLCTLISGHKALVKLSSNDKHFIPLIAKFLEYQDASFKDLISITDEKLTNFDATIATGSNNTARYFEYYFGKKPHIIRKNRNSAAILTGKESQEELELLGEDIFRYYGLGCRSVSKLFVPKSYNFDAFFKAMFKFKDVINYKKYQNNYDYNKAVYLMSLFKLQENGFLTLKEDENYASPIATLFYEFYDSEETLKEKLKNDSEKIQCLVGNYANFETVNFGETQQPKLWDYADGVDTLSFLTSL